MSKPTSSSGSSTWRPVDRRVQRDEARALVRDAREPVAARRQRRTQHIDGRRGKSPPARPLPPRIWRLAGSDAVRAAGRRWRPDRRARSGTAWSAVQRFKPTACVIASDVTGCAVFAVRCPLRGSRPLDPDGLHRTAPGPALIVRRHRATHEQHLPQQTRCGNDHAPDHRCSTILEIAC